MKFAKKSVNICAYQCPLKNMRKSTLFISFILFCSGFLVFLLWRYPLIGIERYERSLQKKAQMVKRLQLTDLCLFTEARYTRHLSQADLFSAFQDHPMSFEHFPSGSFTVPTIRLRAEREKYIFFATDTQGKTQTKEILPGRPDRANTVICRK